LKALAWLFVLLIPYLIIQFRARKTVPSSALKDKSVLITGCDTGFGNLTALKLAANGDIKVFAGCLTKKGLEDLKAKSPQNLIPFPLDVTNQESIENAFDFVKKGLTHPEGLWGVINNAGLLRVGLSEVASYDEMKLMFDVNVFGLAMISRRFIPLLRKCKGSRLINIASVAGRLSGQGLGAYAASKFAVEALSDALRRELYCWGVKVVIIEPGVMKTNLYDAPFKDTIDQLWPSIPEDAKEAYGRSYFEKQLEEAKKLLDLVGGNPTKVVDTLVHAVTSEHPPDRIAVGFDSPIWIGLSYLPSFASDFLLRLLEYNHPVPLALQRK